MSTPTREDRAAGANPDPDPVQKAFEEPASADPRLPPVPDEKPLDNASHRGAPEGPAHAGP